MNVRTGILCGLIVLVVLALPAARALAADSEDGYVVPTSKPARTWVAVVYAMVFLAGIGIVAIKNAKRTHLG